MKVTINDIARMSHVSKSTVSRFLNGGSVSKTTADKIRRVITETGYESNLFASSLKRKKTRMIGVVFKGIQSVSVGKMLEVINEQLREADYYPLITIESLSNSLEQEIEDLLTLNRQGVDGIILGTDNITEKHREVIKGMDIPVILVGQESQDIPYRKIDNVRAGHLVGEYIDKMGHENIAYLGPSEEDREVGFHRKKGVMDYFDQKNKSVSILNYKTGYTFEAGYEQGRKVLAEAATVAVCATDRIAMGLIQYLKEQDYLIPEDLSIIGFGNYDFSSVISPGLTTVSFDYKRLSELVVQDMIQLINDEALGNVDDVEMKLVERESVRNNN
ncbi:transcriptional regulator, LacI family [Pelagirhabdus alkalitolerans]|uniref:Transcriptional regulator, LacI family n=1 Tax=Pelagirhabdus alkalitolerans TaxID=1612202 RepID=A0A1G6GND6_9BACI|nr:LacI family DNA-binding transcriptional regulator [Pelagirhabdus alkalitolerans]SDB83469.1 transcriptional regulator, LacI family [Pelagirhabdus alkalitolerans]